MSKLKIALCLSGEPRSTMASFPYIYESFLQNNPDYEVDVYIHSWKGFRALDLYNPKSYKLDIWDPNPNFHNFIDNLSLELKNTDSSLNLKSLRTPNIHPLKNVYLMFYSIKGCFNLINKKYDYYIRSRLDLYYPQKLYLGNFLGILHHSDIDLILPLKTFSNGQPTICDQIAIGTYNGFKVYCDTILNLNNLIKSTNSLSPEVLLENQLINNQVKYRHFYFDHYSIKRSNIFSDDLNFKDE